MGTEQSNRVLAAIGAVSAILAAGGSSVFASQIKAQKSDTPSGYTRHTHVSLQSVETLNKVKNGADRQTSVIYTGHNAALDNVKVQTMQPVLRTVNVQKSQQHTYAVKTGDSLWSIAAAKDTTVNELMANNQLTSSIIHVGQKLSLETLQPTSSEASTMDASAAPSEDNNPLQTLNLVSAVDTKVDQTKDDNVVQSDVKSTSTEQTANASADSLSSTVVTSAATSATDLVSVLSASKGKVTTSVAPTSQQAKAVTTNNVISTLAAGKTVTSQVSSTATSTQTATLSSSKVTTSSAATSVSSSTMLLKSQSNSDVSNVVTSNATTKRAASVSSQAAPASSAAVQSTPDQASTSTQMDEPTQPTTLQAATTVSAAPTPSQPNYTADQSTRTKVVQTAVDYQNQQVPYVWGGASTQGTDCSGLVQQAYASAGVSLPHNTVAQEAYFNAQPVNAAQPGDVLFWGPQGATYHNAIAIGDSQYIAAPEPGKNVQTYTMDGQNFMPSFSGSLRQ
ncbi:MULTISPECIES: NlpC/P60 family protein [Furfurilactobacillus]|uniref:LysM peptidoglycan-binding domain-containing protein n=1 Tax=Furfurilactobacillus rossiae TaxID=231049 RepID=A0A7C9MND2_9LACO|nr:NlpC/P60 family protein [Furfurilactobacillus milii]MYV04864.1 LysM peptidoglycan-binding domain-containing protein [Furfurilactobacillus milii]